MIEEIEKGFSAVKLALGAAPQPFFRFPYLQDPKEAVAYLGSRNIAIFSHDLDSFDFKIHKPEDVVKSVMTKLERKGKGIILMHDFQAGDRQGPAGHPRRAQGQGLQGGAHARQDAAGNAAAVGRGRQELRSRDCGQSATARPPA